MYRGRPVGTMNNTGWQQARKRAGLPQVRVHDLKHTFGRRLRAAGVSFEDRQDLLGHRSGRITTHYSAAELRTWSRQRTGYATEVPQSSRARHLEMESAGCGSGKRLICCRAFDVKYL